jgi:hypothetical protein
LSTFSIEDNQIFELESINQAFYGASHSLDYINGEFMSLDNHGYVYQFNRYVPEQSMKSSIQMIKLHSIKPLTN